MRARVRNLRNQLRAGFWLVPTVCVVLAIALSFAIVEIDRRAEGGVRFTFGAGPDGAREVLGAITTAMITFTGLVFSITVVVLQLTSSQFSPRVLRNFLRDRLTQWSLGVFTATFVYTVLVLRTVRSADQAQPEFVPGLATTASLGLLLLSVALFVAYIHHISTAIQASSIIAAIGVESKVTLERRYPRDPTASCSRLPSPQGEATLVVPAPTSGVLVRVDEEMVVALTQAADVIVRMQLRRGDYIPEGSPLLEVIGDPARLDTAALLSAVTQGRERQLEDDLAFGFRQLVDIAERALSPGINDPTTAVQAIDELHDMLRRLTMRPLHSGVYEDPDGRVRLVLPPEDLDYYLHLALDEVCHYGADAQQVQGRVQRLLSDIASVAAPEHRATIDRFRVTTAPRGADGEMAGSGWSDAATSG